MNEEHLLWLDGIIDDECRYLSGDGPRPDVEHLGQVRRAEAIAMIEIVDALACSLPAPPAFADDPVAHRLGLVGGGVNYTV